MTTTEEDGLPPIIELYPSEEKAATILWADIQRKYGTRPDSVENLRALAKEVTDRFAEEIGLVVHVDISNFVPNYNLNKLVASPIIHPVGRVNKLEFDFSRAQYETRMGYADGKPGVISESGVWRDPKKNL